ncbi:MULTISPECIES: DUF6988 family protein [Burkholderia cepacia complex]|jgi:hypothetical protein|uniref:Uncharacterized protein n=5 Tax=Burkholderia TaxID=32008 RepID=A0A250LLL5_9BURK|nr:hypothetical protein BCCH1_79250 [Burkholderia contaminans]CAB3974631.1 hypothetical protein BLA3211_08111 [Burkholderia aenigmatica]VWD62122.1 hypothetical protein BCO37747_07497 [Burkholderia contaminans]
MREMMLTMAVQRSQRWMDACANLVDGVAFQTTLRARVVVALHHLCIEHHLAGHVLVENDVRGSAFALYRPQFEAYVRANWYLECASEGDLEKFVEGEEPPRMPQLTADLAVALGQAGEIIGSVKAQAWRSMCAFTHGGAVQVKARAIKDEIRQSFTDEHTSKLIDSMAMLSYLGALGIAKVADDGELAQRLYERHQVIYSVLYGSRS